MNVAALAVVTVLIFAEKSLPLGQRMAQVAALALIAYGVLVMVVPSVLPTMRSPM
jgi:predicted metal-binding membrane protein